MPLRVPSSPEFLEFRRRFPVEGDWSNDGLPIIEPWLACWYGYCFPDGEPAASTIMDCRTKKQGKSSDGGAALVYMATKHPSAELVIASSDLDQSRDRILRSAKYGVSNSGLADHCTIRKDELLFDNASYVKAIPSDWRGSAGGNHVMVCWDELHTNTTEPGAKLFDELQIPPTQKRGVRWIASYAGWAGQSLPLERLWDLALKGERVPNEFDLPIYYNEAADILALIDVGPASWRQPWMTAEFIERIKLTERQTSFRRQYLNEWVTGENAFISAEQWEACRDPELRLLSASGPILPSKLHLGLDAAVYRDRCALIGTCRDKKNSRLEVRYVKIWTAKEQVSGGRPAIDLNEVGAEVVRLHRLGVVADVTIDPYQLMALSQQWTQAGIKVIEFGQTTARIESDELLLDLIRNKGIVHPGYLELTKQVLAATGRETPRGLRLDKSATKLPIDGAVALAMSCHTALGDTQFHSIRFMAIAGNEFNKRAVIAPEPGKAAGPIARNARARKELQARYFGDASEAAGQKLAEEYSRLSDARRTRIFQLQALGMESWQISRQLSIERKIVEVALGERDLVEQIAIKK